MQHGSAPIKVGTHTVYIEDDTVILVQNGTYHLEDARLTHVSVERILYGLGRVFVMVDQTNAGPTAPDARRFLRDWNKRHKASGAVMFGGSSMSIAAASFALSVIRFLQADALPVAYMKNEEEARAWIAQQRDRLLAAKGRLAESTQG